MNETFINDVVQGMTHFLDNAQLEELQYVLQQQHKRRKIHYYCHYQIGNITVVRRCALDLFAADCDVGQEHCRQRG